MGKGAWAILVLVGVAIAIGLGLVATSQSVAEARYCDDLESLESSVTSLTGSTSTSEFQSNASAVQSAWGSVKNSAQHLSGVNMSSLDNAWNSFAKAIENVPDSGSVRDAAQSIAQSAQGLGAAAVSSLDSYHCNVSTSSS